MFKILLTTASYGEFSDEEYSSILNDILVSIVERLGCDEEGASIGEGGSIVFDSEMSEREIKDILKPVFSYHFDFVRFKAIEVI